MSGERYLKSVSDSTMKHMASHHTKIFITHSHQDNEFGERLNIDLRAHGFDCFFDITSLKGGERIAEKISRALEECDVYLPILSSAALRSPWCREEIFDAVTLSNSPGRDSRPRIVPVLVEECESELPVPLKARLYFKFTGRYEDAFMQLLERGLEMRKSTAQNLPSSTATSSQAQAQGAPRSRTKSSPTHDLGNIPQLGLGTIVNPFHKSLCPYCFNRIHIGNCEIVSSIDPSKVLTSMPRGLKKILYRFWIPSLVGPLYARELARRKCYNCGNLLPHNLEYMDNQVIAIVGGPASGKSTYIASLVEQLEKDELLESIGCEQFGPISRETEERYELEYHRPLFHDHVNTRTTGLRESLEPLIYVLTFRRRSNKTRVKRLNLVLFDGSGEGIMDQVTVARFARYLVNASAIIFMVDPLSLPSFYMQLPAHLRPMSNGVSADPAKILNHIVEQCQIEKGIIGGTQQLDIAVAITLTKSDLFKYAVDPESSLTLLKDPPYYDGFKLDDFEEVNKEVVELIKRFDGMALFRSSRTFKRVAFFAVSATGSAAQNGKYPLVIPRRCPDPILWILWQLGYIEVS